MVLNTFKVKDYKVRKFTLDRKGDANEVKGQQRLFKFYIDDKGEEFLTDSVYMYSIDGSHNRVTPKFVPVGKISVETLLRIVPPYKVLQLYSKSTKKGKKENVGWCILDGWENKIIKYEKFLGKIIGLKCVKKK